MSEREAERPPLGETDPRWVPCMVCDAPVERDCSSVETGLPRPLPHETRRDDAESTIAALARPLIAALTQARTEGAAGERERIAAALSDRACTIQWPTYRAGLSDAARFVRGQS